MLVYFLECIKNILTYAVIIDSTSHCYTFCFDLNCCYVNSLTENQTIMAAKAYSKTDEVFQKPFFFLFFS